MRTPINTNSGRRNLLKVLLTTPLVIPAGILSGTPAAMGQDKKSPARKKNLKLSLNAYSFNAPLSNGSMTIDDLLEFCSEKGLPAVDITAYYFPGYPRVPADEYLYHVKRKAFSLGLEISGTGVRNDFTEPDPAKRKESVALVKNWIDASEKIGAPVIRIFSGTQKPAGYSREQILEWMLKDIRECIDYGKAHGVVVAIQNHNDFIKTAEHVTEIIQSIHSEWFGLILDIGSYRTADPYDEIARTAQYAVSWQVKEKVFVGGKEVDVDLEKLFNIISTSGYKGYLPLETLGAGDPKAKVSALLDKVNKFFC